MQPEQVNEQGDRPAAVQQAARLLCTARVQRHRFDRLPATCVPGTEAEAYAIQDLLHQCLAAHHWGTIVGYKIGCTTPVMQAYLGIHSPCAGGVFDTSVQRLQGHVPIPPALRIGVECEIAVQLRESLTPTAAPYDRTGVAGAIGACMAAIEIVEDRYVDYPSLDTPTLIADDFFGAGCVLGTPREGFYPFELPAVQASMHINGQSVGAGVGTDILGHPLDALVWLANNTTGRGASLQAGEFVLLGSLVQTHWVERGDEVMIRSERLGEVRASFA